MALNKKGGLGKGLGKGIDSLGRTLFPGNASFYYLIG